MYLGIDIGGTFIKLALTDAQCRICARAEVPVKTGEGQPLLSQAVMKAAEAFLQAQGVSPEGIGISATGEVNPEGVVIGSNNSIPGWDNTDLAGQFRSRFAVPVAALNDANAAALGEWRSGSGQGCSDMLMVTLGTGVGGGIISGGRLLTGTLGIAGEMGHFTLHRNGEPCTCGRRGCFEQYASTGALSRRVQAATGEILSGREIFRRAAAGDARMLAVIDAWTDDIADGLSGLIHILNPERVVIGGGVSAQQELLIDALRCKLPRFLMPCFTRGLTVTAASLGNDAGVIGAVRFLMDRQASC